MQQAKITLLPGDGVGPEVVAAARRVLDAAAQRFDCGLAYEEALLGGCAIDATGSPLPEETVQKCQQADAVLLGAVGGPKWDNPTGDVRPEQGLLGLRKALKVFANLRPVKVHPKLAHTGPLGADRIAGIDMLIVRELTGGIYFGERGRRQGAHGESAFDTMEYSVGEIERVVRLAAQIAERRSGRLTSVDKANVLEVSRLWRSTATRVVTDEFPEVTLDHVLVDAAAMYLIQQPKRFDVMVTGNLFGDILSDEASVLAGSMGMLPSASLGESGPGLYEPVHGSAPDIAGKGVANPVGMILSAALMCRESLGWHDVADCIEQAVDAVLEDGVRTLDIAGPDEATVGTEGLADAVIAAMEQTPSAKSAVGST